MNLVIDIGNTLIKYAVFKGRELHDKKLQPSFDLKDLNTFISALGPPEGIIITTVREEDPGLVNTLRELSDHFIFLNRETPLPIKNSYKSKETLGYDRIAALTGAQDQFPGTELLVIDAGTAITYDFLSAKGVFTGGNISPGAGLRARCLNSFTSKLPEVNPFTETGEIGKDTEGALIAGIMQGIYFEMNGYIDLFLKKNPEGKVILTGGDALYFDKKLKNSIFVDQNLNLYGLNRILEYNAK